VRDISVSWQEAQACLSQIKETGKVSTAQQRQALVVAIKSLEFLRAIEVRFQEAMTEKSK